MRYYCQYRHYNIIIAADLFYFLHFLTYHRRSVNTTSHSEEAGTELVALHREVDEAVQTLVQLAATPCDEVQLAPGFVITTSQTGVVENAVSDSTIAHATPRSSTPSNHITDVLPALTVQIESQDTTSVIQLSTSAGPNSDVVGVANTPPVCLGLDDSLVLSGVFDDRNANQDPSSLHFTSPEGFDLPELRSRYGVELDISSLGLTNCTTRRGDTDTT